ncbi:MAG: methyl-accepting chemotaxis protein [Peptostreptococcaceae bacterium]|jgi:methyl-accepting chemotaxis protein|nr:methyl-accepting chemotaxis protein [Peptostreptococcaceae bacterium]
MNKSIKNRLIIYFSIIVIGTILLLGTASIRRASNSLEDSINNDIALLANQTAGIVRKAADIQMRSLETLGRSPIISEDIYSLEEKLKYLKDEAIANNHLRMNYIDKDGNGYVTTGSTFDGSSREYFKLAMKGESYISEPIVSKVDGSIVMVVSAPIINSNNEIIGAVTATRDGNNLGNIIKDLRYGETGYAYVIDDKGIIIGHKDQSLVKEQYNLLEKAKSEDLLLDLAELTKKMINRESGYGNYMWTDGAKKMGYAPIEGTNWSIAITSYSAENEAPIKRLVYFLITYAIIILIVSIVAIYFIGKSIARPILKIAEYTRILANGNLNVFIDQKLLDREDELGSLAKDFKTLRSNFKELIENIIDSSGIMLDSAVEFSKSSKRALESFEEISDSVDDIAKNATDQAASTQEGLSRSNELGEVIDSEKEMMNELSDSFSMVANSVEEGMTIVNDLATKTNEGNVAIKEVYEGIIKTNESSKEIGSASETIASIAEQTNLLALNAAIEAARAGEMGKGFAVVAEEVRKLAEQSTQFTNVIDETVKELLQNSTSSVQNIEKVYQIIEEQATKVDETKEKYENIMSAMNESESASHDLERLSENMKTSKDTILEVLQNLSDIAQQNAASTEEASASSQAQISFMQGIARSSQDLEDIAKNLKELSSKFIIK